MLKGGLLVAVALCLVLTVYSWAGAAALSADVVIYGGTPADLSAAEAVIRNGKTAIIIEPTSHVGGMITGGIAVTDTGTPQYVGGISHEFFERISAAEASRKGGAHVMQLRGKTVSWYEPRAWDLEPTVAKRIFGEWINKDY